MDGDRDGDPLPYSGERDCMIISQKKGRICSNKAKFYHRGGAGICILVCGAHEKTLGKPCDPLPIDEDRTRKQIAAYDAHVEAAFNATLARPAGEKGRLACMKVSAMRMAPFRENFLNVMLVLDASRRRDGIDGSSLAPSNVGPVKHEQPGLPVARTLTGYVVGSEVWTCEMDLEQRTPTLHWYDLRADHYRSVIVRRPKYRLLPQSNKIEYSVFLTLAGQERRFDAVEARYFFCTAYADLIAQRPLFKKLRRWHADGVDLCFCGFEGTEVPWPTTADTLYREFYCNARVTFSCELTLLALLLCNDTHDELPWDRYRREFPSLYSGIARINATTAD